jgi:hypothetical protein
MTFRVLLPALIAAVLALAGCGSSMLDTFPGFPDHKARLGKSTIIADFIILKATADTASSRPGSTRKGTTSQRGS